MLIDRINYAVSLTCDRYPDEVCSIWASRFILGIDRTSKTLKNILDGPGIPLKWGSVFSVVNSWQKSLNRDETTSSRMFALDECERLLEEFFISENIPKEHYKL